MFLQATERPQTSKTARELRNLGWVYPHVKGRGQEAIELQKQPHKRPRCWVVEVTYSWFNRLRKLLVRYEKLDRSFLALNHLAAAIIALRKVPIKVNIIYG
ncbi:hypothetical protein NB231_11374 [Nitrococcus mobilis Nb-231]|uniref:Transposase DDE domain-containing protein n=1 Tax=Nitrococcus mobilis Nb-231 TaxID=314278 RepID=A4BP32_9GAMM|nr:transposase [Nitrococcus mobilis]EAR22333.1 hypothetical protein NB231_11374 [Nitrococcus mobilis Nb-231]